PRRAFGSSGDGAPRHAGARSAALHVERSVRCHPLPTTRPDRRGGGGAVPLVRLAGIGDPVHAPVADPEHSHRRLGRRSLLRCGDPDGYPLEPYGREGDLAMTRSTSILPLVALGVCLFVGRSSADWSMFHGDPRHSGAANQASSANVAWSYVTNDSVEFSSPAIGPDGTIYVANQGGSIYALRNGGNRRWKL